MMPEKGASLPKKSARPSSSSAMCHLGCAMTGACGPEGVPPILRARKSQGFPSHKLETDLRRILRAASMSSTGTTNPLSNMGDVSPDVGDIAATISSLADFITSGETDLTGFAEALDCDAAKPDASLAQRLLLNSARDAINARIAAATAAEADAAEKFDLANDAYVDCLMKIPNPTALAKFGHEIVRKCVKSGVGVAVLFVDFDRFKFINDTYGHDAGDYVLQKVARILQENVKLGDLVARKGGDEVLIIIQACGSATMAAGIAERLRKKVETTTFEHDGKILPVTVSIGVAPSNGRITATLDSLTTEADKALYAAKKGDDGHGSRNRVAVAQ